MKALIVGCALSLIACTGLKSNGDDEHAPDAGSAGDAAAGAGSGGGSGRSDGGDSQHPGGGNGGSSGSAGGDANGGTGNAGASGSAGDAANPGGSGAAGSESGGSGNDDSGAGEDAGQDAGTAPIDPCSADPAPCDALQTCDGASGDAVCSACPTGYVDAAPGVCEPVLLDFVVSTGVLTPAFDPTVHEYAWQLPLQAQPAIKASAQSPIEIAVGLTSSTDRAALESGDIWSPDAALPFGTTDIDVELHAGDRALVVYRIHVTRGLPSYLKASNTGTLDDFGHSVAISGDTLVVGAPYEDSASKLVENVAGTSFTQDNEDADGAGAAYVFVLRDGHWQQQAYLKASNAGMSDSFGESVAISGDRIVIGARLEASASTGVNDSTPGENDDSKAASGAAYVFVRSAGSWSQEAYLKASNSDEGDRFGTSVAISGDTIVVGAQYERSASTGINDATPGEGDNSAEFSGAAYVFARSGAGWAQTTYLKASGLSRGFGAAVAIDADTIIVGAPSDFAFKGGAYIFARSAGVWMQQAVVQGDQSDDGAGFSVAVSGNVAVVGAPGDSTSINGVVLGAPASFDTARASSGAALVLQRGGGGTTWGQIGYFKAPTSRSNEQYGWSVAVSGTRIAIGSIGDSGSLINANSEPAANDTAASFSGAAFVYLRTTGSNEYTLEAYLKAHATHAQDQLGSSVALSPAFIAVGEALESSGSRGVDDPTPGPDDISIPESGALYVY